MPRRVNTSANICRARTPGAVGGGGIIGTLIKQVHLFGDDRLVDFRIDGGIVQYPDPGLAYSESDQIIDGSGGLLLPGLHDHHIHLMAFAASLDSLPCGPPAIRSEAEFAAALQRENREKGKGWLRGIAYHPCIAGDIDRDWLDHHIPDRPVRIQHRGGRMWVLNSRALEALRACPGDAPPGLECRGAHFTGRLYEADHWLRQRLNSRPPDLSRASRRLASYGITGITDTTPTNGAKEWEYFRQCQETGSLKQRVRMMGSPELWDYCDTGSLTRGELKIHLLESHLPDWKALSRDIEMAHRVHRTVAVHCVTLTELVFTLSVFQVAGVLPGDRIEHASVCPPEQMEVIRQLGLRVVTQPHFIAERGDQYLSDVEESDQHWLYRAASFLTTEIPLAGGSDAPFGHADPWQSMRAAVERRTSSGQLMDTGEALTPEQAMALFLSPADKPGTNISRIEHESRADLCLLHRPWQVVREDLSCSHVRMTWRDGELVYSSS